MFGKQNLFFAAAIALCSANCFAEGRDIATATPVAPILLGTTVMLSASDGIQNFSSALPDASTWTVDAIRSPSPDTREVDLLRKDKVVKQTIRLGATVVKDHAIRNGDVLSIERLDKRNFILKRGQITLSPLTYPQRNR